MAHTMKTTDADKAAVKQARKAAKYRRDMRKNMRRAA
jgi:hypothetical protein